MTATSPPDPRLEERIRDSFPPQAFMSTPGASLRSVTPVIELLNEPRLTQQHGLVHAGMGRGARHSDSTHAITTAIMMA